MGTLYIGDQKVCPAIVTGGGTSEKYGASIDNMLGDVDANGSLQESTETFNLVFNGVKILEESYVLAYKFYRFSNLTGVSFPDLEIIQTGSYILQYAFSNASITSISFPKLQTIYALGAFQAAFSFNSALTQVDFPELTTITGAAVTDGQTAFSQCFTRCTSLAQISFPKLNLIDKASIFSNCFSYCTSIQHIYFNALKTTSFGSNVNQFNNMMTSTGTTVTHTIHFPSNLESTISGLTGYPLFGGTSGYVVLSFDLPATE